VKNVGEAALDLAPWAITMLAPGSTAIMPLGEKAPHDMEHLLPESQLSLWSYTDFSDERWTFLPDHLSLRHDATPSGRFAMQKTGLFHPDGWVAGLSRRYALIKMVAEADKKSIFPDGGCNLEAFTNPEFLEIETLGSMTTLLPGEERVHSEWWKICELPEMISASDAIEDIILPEIRFMRQHRPATLL
jgi:hypothetical protein